MRPDWVSGLSGVCGGGKPLVILFSGEGEALSDDFFLDASLDQASRDKATFVMIEPLALSSAKEEKTFAPKSWDERDDVWQAYGVSRAGTVVVADCYGNECSRFTSKPAARQLLSSIDQVGPEAAKRAKNVERAADRAEKALESDNVKSAMDEVKKVFRKADCLGMDGFQRLVTVYESLLEKGAESLEKAVETGDVKALTGLLTLYMGTDLENKIKEANIELRKATTQK